VSMGRLGGHGGSLGSGDTARRAVVMTDGVTEQSPVVGFGGRNRVRATEGCPNKQTKRPDSFVTVIQQLISTPIPSSLF
jgi:hypothetical protein